MPHPLDPIEITVSGDAERDPALCPGCGLTALIVGIAKSHSALCCRFCRTQWTVPTSLELLQLAHDRVRVAETQERFTGAQR